MVVFMFNVVYGGLFFFFSSAVGGSGGAAALYLVVRRGAGGCHTLSVSFVLYFSTILSLFGPYLLRI